MRLAVNECSSFNFELSTIPDQPETDKDGYHRREKGGLITEVVFTVVMMWAVLLFRWLQCSGAHGLSDRDDQWGIVKEKVG